MTVTKPKGLKYLFEALPRKLKYDQTSSHSLPNAVLMNTIHENVSFQSYFPNQRYKSREEEGECLNLKQRSTLLMCLNNRIL